jgi:hypothetical protein
LLLLLLPLLLLSSLLRGFALADESRFKHHRTKNHAQKRCENKKARGVDVVLFLTCYSAASAVPAADAAACLVALLWARRNSAISGTFLCPATISSAES